MGIHWVIAVTLIVIYIQGQIYRRYGLKHIRYTRYFNLPAVYEGDEVELVEEIANEKLLPVPVLTLESMLHAGLQFRKQFNLEINDGEYYQNHRSYFSLRPYVQITRRHSIRCVKRGYYALNSASLSCADVLGLGSATATVRIDAKLLVYPKLVPIEDIPLPSHSWLGDVVVRRWIIDDPFMISGVREYRYGDALNHVNWKATARTGTLQVHNKDYTADHRFMIYLNFDVSKEMWNAVSDPELIERGISYAASIAQYALSRGIETGFACNGQLSDDPKRPVRVRPHNGSGQFTLLLETMAKLAIVRSGSLETLLQEEISEGTTNTDFLFICAYLSDAERQLVDRLVQNGNAAEMLWLHPERHEERRWGA